MDEHDKQFYINSACGSLQDIRNFLYNHNPIISGKVLRRLTFLEWKTKREDSPNNQVHRLMEAIHDERLLKSTKLSSVPDALEDCDDYVYDPSGGCEHYGQRICESCDPLYRSALGTCMERNEDRWGLLRKQEQTNMTNIVQKQRDQMEYGRSLAKLLLSSPAIVVFIANILYDKFETLERTVHGFNRLVVTPYEADHYSSAHFSSESYDGRWNAYWNAAEIDTIFSVHCK